MAVLRENHTQQNGNRITAAAGTGCICDHAGYCPLMRTTMFPEDWERCRTDAEWHKAELKRRGIRTEVILAKPKRCGSCDEKRRRYADELKAAGQAKLSPLVTTKPVVCNRQERAALSLRDQFLGQRVFLVGGGPSLRQVDLNRLCQPGITVAAMNNVATMLRPQIWFSVDMPRNFSETIWRDPGVMKFTLDEHIHSNASIESWDTANSKWVHSGLRIQDCPNVWGFHHRHSWDAALFLDDTVPTWGANQPYQDPEQQAKRTTVMLPAIWLLHWLGFRVIYLLGCDFKVGDGRYAFDEKCRASNDDLFGWMDRRFKELEPYARAKGLEIFNCTEGSALTAFPKLDLDSALAACRDGWPEQVVTKGQYRNP